MILVIYVVYVCTSGVNTDLLVDERCSRGVTLCVQNESSAHSTYSNRTQTDIFDAHFVRNSFKKRSVKAKKPTRFIIYHSDSVAVYSISVKKQTYNTKYFCFVHRKRFYLLNNQGWMCVRVCVCTGDIRYIRNI